MIRFEKKCMTCILLCITFDANVGCHRFPNVDNIKIDQICLMYYTTFLKQNDLSLIPLFRPTNIAHKSQKKIPRSTNTSYKVCIGMELMHVYTCHEQAFLRSRHIDVIFTGSIRRAFSFSSCQVVWRI